MFKDFVDMCFGHKGIRVALPENCEPYTISKANNAAYINVPKAIERSLKDPQGMPALSEFAKRRRNVCILLCDITRPVPNHVVLPQIFDHLAKAGMSSENITILIATGLHRPATDEEKRAIVGNRQIYGSIGIRNHYAEKDNLHAFLGTTTRKTPVLLDKRFVEAELKLVIGLVEPHFMAGYSGGRKLVVPGIAHKKTIMALHSPEFMESPLASNCILEGNPLHLEQLDILKMLGDIFSVNIVIDKDRKMTYVNAGEIVESHEEAVSVARSISEFVVPRKFRTILTSGGGYPLDKTYYQTVKGMVAALDVLEPRGDIIIVSECSEGFGSAPFREAQALLNRLGPAGFLQTISDVSHIPIVDQWQTEKLAAVLRCANVRLFAAGLTEEDWQLTSVRKISDVQEALLNSINKNESSEIAVIPEGPYVIPIQSDQIS